MVEKTLLHTFILAETRFFQVAFAVAVVVLFVKRFAIPAARISRRSGCWLVWPVRWSGGTFDYALRKGDAGGHTGTFHFQDGGPVEFGDIIEVAVAGAVFYRRDGGLINAFFLCCF